MANILRDQRIYILEEWLKQQVAAASRRADLISEADLRMESERFLDALAVAVRSGNYSNIGAPEYEPVITILEGLSRSRGVQSFTPSETAMFVFSLKQPIFDAFNRSGDKAVSEQIAEMWPLNLLIDRLSLFTTEAHQRAREEVIRRQQEEMLELSTPVVQIWEGILALPLIGTLDSTRTNVVMETLLETIVQTRSELAILDITGVPTVDTLVAQYLLRTVAAARLMGADCIISGIRPQIAQTMVHLQIDLSAVTTKATLADALRFAMQRSARPVASTSTHSSPKD
ncbi:MAG: STAS domain-containing protein [Verrucomicrobia bacterium]|nr:STAS domain-containing protein [Verrucomicrobiota bacterium]